MLVDPITNWLETHSGSANSMRFDLPKLKSFFHQILPVARCPFILVGGTNAKGSTTCFLQNTLSQAGYKVGRYTSPHLQYWQERISIDGVSISNEGLLKHLNATWSYLSVGEHLTVFEVLTLSAICYFEALHDLGECDIAILEVGMGGRQDMTNIVDPIFSIITCVDLDHCHYLGNNKQSIGYEKAGIMRSKRPVIFVDADMPDSVNQYAKTVGANLIHAKHALNVERGNRCYIIRFTDSTALTLQIPASDFLFALRYPYGLLATCLSIAPLLERGFCIESKNIARVASSFSMVGRRSFHLFKKQNFLLDVGHNPHAIASLVNDVLKHMDQKIPCIFYVLNDKNAKHILYLLADYVDVFYIPINLPSDRGFSDEQWVENTDGYQKKCMFFKNLDACMEALPSTNDAPILVVGSFVLAGEFLSYIA